MVIETFLIVDYTISVLRTDPKSSSSMKIQNSALLFNSMAAFDIVGKKQKVMKVTSMVKVTPFYGA